MIARATLSVLIFAIFISLINSTSFFLGILNTPPGNKYLGTIHYYEDYFYYVNHYVQGARGNFLTVAQYTHEIVPKAPIYWSNLLFGKIWGLFGIEVTLAYNLSALIVNATIILIAFIFFKKIFKNNPLYTLPATLFFTLATSLSNLTLIGGNFSFSPYYLWRTPHFAFDRLGGTPHNQTHAILYLVLLLVYFSQTSNSRIEYLKILICFLLGILVTLLQPISGAFLIILLLLTHLLSFKKISSSTVMRFVFTTLPILLAGFYTVKLYNLPPYSQAKLWELSQQAKTDIHFLLFSLGPIAFFSIFGIIKSLRRRSPFILFGALATLITYFLFFSDLPRIFGISNHRLFSPIQYIFLAVLAVDGIVALYSFLALRFKFLNERTLVIFFTAIFVILSLPTLEYELNKKIEFSRERSVLLYLPNEIFTAFQKLKAIGDPIDTVLANPNSYMSVLTPALSGHTTYVGHGLMTINFQEKRSHALSFFYSPDPPEGKTDWLTTNRIKYVLFTNLDGDLESFKTNHPNLKAILINEKATIFELL